MSKYLISFGYPMGFFNNEELEGIVSINDDTVILDAVKYTAWQIIFKYGVKEEFVEEYKTIFDDIDVEDVLNNLKDNDLVMEIDDEDDIELYFEKLKDVRLYRQGFGMGLDSENNDLYKIAIMNYELKVTLLEYIIWSSADNKLTLGDIYKNMVEKGFKDLKVFIFLVLNLYQENLIYIMR